MGGEIIQHVSRQRMSEARRINHYVHTPRTVELMKTFSHQDLLILSDLVQSHSYKGVVDFIGTLVKEQLDDQTVNQLRNRARSFGIPKYWSMSKSELLKRILDVTTARSDVDGNVTPPDKKDAGAEPKALEGSKE